MRYGYISPHRLSAWLHTEVSLVARRRLRDEGSIYQRSSDQRWVGVVDLGLIDGKRVRKTVTAPTLRELKPKFAALKESLGSGVDDDHMTVGTWMTKWLEEVAPGRNRDSTLHTYRLYVKKWVEPHLGRVQLSKLRPDHVRGMLRAMEADGKSDATRRQVLAILSRALKVAVQDQLIARNPVDAIDRPSVGKGSHGKFTLEEAKRLLAACQGDDRAIKSRWVAALLAGLRQGEALGLTWENVDLDRGLIFVTQAAQQVPGKGLQIVGLKSDASHRAVPMVEPVKVALAAEPRRTGYVWGTDEAPRRPRQDWQDWKDFIASVPGVPDRPLHAARATCGSLLLDAGVSSKVIAEILGHSQVQVTERHYLHGDDAMRRTAMERLDGLELVRFSLPPASPAT